ncbi:MAG: ABC transporter permease, partial [Deltaproteobacteria bacterium]|nr:ABC transporter permease [Deltaproteobacteria bacterium]
MRRSNWISMALVAAVIVVWEGACRWLGVPDFILPPPTAVIETTIVKAPLLLPHAGVTALEIVAGIVLSLVVAIPLATLMFSLPSVERALSPFLVASQAVPVFALAPLLVIWLG